MNLIKYFLVSLVTAGEKEEFSNHINKPVNVLISQYAGSRSHVKFLLEIANELSEKGHKVTYATPKQKQHFGKGYKVNMYNMGSIQYEGWSDHFSINYLPPLYDEFFPTYETLIKDTKPDVVICDFFSAACVDYCQIHQIPYIVGMQALNPRSNPTPYINDNVSIDIPTTTERMSFWSRWYNTFFSKDSALSYRLNFRKKLNDLRTKYGIPHRVGYFGDFETSYKMLNTYLGWEAPRPLHPTFELVGPISTTNIAPLTQELTTFLDQWNKVLYIAFGSYQTLSTKELELIIQASFKCLADGTINGVILATKTKKSDFPDEFHTVNGIVKTADLFDDKIPGFKLMEYAPQEAILKHSSTKLFISHGGLESTFESISTSTPILIMPFIADQPGNGQLVIENNLGGMINKAKDTYSTISQEIKRIVADQDGSIKRDIKRVRTIAHYKSIGIGQAGDKIISFAKVAKACRTGKELKNETPCEMKHMVTVDQKISHFKAYQYDIYVFHYTLVTLIICTLVPFIIKYLKLSRYFKAAKREGYRLLPINSNGQSSSQ